MKVPHFSLKFTELLSWKSIMFFWYRHYKAMFFCGFLVVLAFGGLFWYEHLYQFQWDETKKKEFLDKNFKETNFKEQAFMDTIARLKARAEMHVAVPELSRDIFSAEPQP